jgi:hypothetical protein
MHHHVRLYGGALVRVATRATIAIFLFALSLPCHAAVSATAVWEVRPSTGADTNGGGFDPGVTSPGTDFSQQGAAQFAFTDLVVGATTTQFTSVAHPVGSTFPGNLINITGGSGCTTGWFEILSNSTITATVDRSLGTATSVCTGNLGGALKTLTQLNTNMIAGNQAWVKAEATIGTTVSYQFNFGGSGTVASPIVGYTTTRGDGGYVTIQASTELPFANAIIDLRVQGASVSNFVLDCNSQTSQNGLNIQGTASIQGRNILAENCPGTGVSFNNQAHACIRCIVLNSANGINLDGNNGPNSCYYCAVLNGTSGPGFTMSYGVCYRCISANNVGSSAHGFSLTNSCCAQTSLISSVAYNDGGDGLRFTGGIVGLPVIENSVFFGNTGFGVNATSGSFAADGYAIDYNAFGSNTAGARNGVAAGTGDVVLTADPFTNGAGNVFTINTTAGGGAALKAAGYPGVFSVGGTTVGTGSLDIGALQSGAGGGGGGGGASLWTPLLPE